MSAGRGISSLTHHLRVGTEGAQLLAAQALQQAMHSDPARCREAAAAGAAPVLLQLLDSGRSAQLQSAAFAALCSLIEGEPLSVQAAGGIRVLVNLLDRSSTAEGAAEALARLLRLFRGESIAPVVDASSVSADSVAAVEAAVSEGAIPSLLRLVEGNNDRAASAAYQSLMSMALAERGNHRTAIGSSHPLACAPGQQQ